MTRILKYAIKYIEKNRNWSCLEWLGLVLRRKAMVTGNAVLEIGSVGKSECVVSDGHGRYGVFSWSTGFRFANLSEKDEFRRNPDETISNRLGQAQTLFLRGDREGAKQLIQDALAMAELAESFGRKPR